MLSRAPTTPDGGRSRSSIADVFAARRAEGYAQLFRDEAVRRRSFSPTRAVGDPRR